MAKVLVVDDDIQATELFQKILTMKGYEAITVNESSQAIQITKSNSPDVILLDLMMPDPNGFEVCKMLRADQDFVQTPIIIISALDDNESKDAAFAAGATDYMEKPLKMDNLVQTIAAALKQ